jgi:hypothetical protein
VSGGPDQQAVRRLDPQQFAAEREIPVVRFAKGQRKDDVAHEHLARFTDPEGIYMIGVAQKKTSTFRTEKRRNPETGASYPWIVAASARWMSTSARSS